jgi:hypothetical protein
MEQSPPYEANSVSAGQEIPRILCNPYRVHKILLLVSILSQLNPILILTISYPWLFTWVSQPKREADYYLHLMPILTRVVLPAPPNTSS